MSGFSLIAIIIIVVLIGSGFLVYSVRLYRRALRSVTWPSVSGVVITAEIASELSDGETRYFPFVEYRYIPEGYQDALTSHVVEYGARKMSHSESGAQGDLIYSVGEEVEVFYDPDNPGQAVLRPGVTFNTRMALLIGCAFFLLSIGMSIVFWVKFSSSR